MLICVEAIKLFKSSAVNEVNERHYSQLKFELKEDLRELTEKFASEEVKKKRPQEPVRSGGGGGTD